MCGKFLSSPRLSCWRWFVLAAALIYSIAPAIAQESQTSGPVALPSLPLSGASMLATSELPTDSSPGYMQIWAELYPLLISSPSISDELLSLLERSGISVAELTPLLEQWMQRSEHTPQEIQDERAAMEARAIEADRRARAAERSRDVWRTGAIVAGGLALLSTAAAAVAIIF